MLGYVYIREAPCSHHNIAHMRERLKKKSLLQKRSRLFIIVIALRAYVLVEYREEKVGTRWQEKVIWPLRDLDANLGAWWHVC